MLSSAPMLRLGIFLFLASALTSAQSLPGVVPGTAQVPGATGYQLISPAVAPTLTPGQIQLMELEGKFQDAVKAGGGKAFASFFADDAVTLSNGKPAILGRGAIAAQANWDAKDYQLIWLPEGAQMGPSNDMGFTWGRYEGHAKDRNGQPIVTSGRYLTLWKKVAGSPHTAPEWKVAMDASADAPPGPAACCTLPATK